MVRELCYVTEWSSRHDGNGHEKQIKNDYGRRAAGDESRPFYNADDYPSLLMLLIMTAS